MSEGPAKALKTTSGARRLDTSLKLERKLKTKEEELHG